MRILIISTYFPPLNSIASHRPYSWAKYWSLAGHEVTVLTMEKKVDPKTALLLPNTGFKLIEVGLPKFMHALKKQYESASLTASCPTPCGRFRSFFKAQCIKIFDYLRFKIGIFNACRMPDTTSLWVKPALDAVKNEKAWDLVISSAGPYTVHLVAEKLKRLKKASKWIADYRDPWSENYLYKGLFPFNIYERYLEKKILASADCITTVSTEFADIYKAKYGKDKVSIIENGYDFEENIPILEEPLLPQDGKYRIIHTGSLYQNKRDPSALFEGIRLLNEDQKNKLLLDKLEVLFIGNRQANLDALIDKYQVGKWVKAFGFVSREKALTLQKEAHALLFLPWNDPAVDGVLTGKIFEYLVVGRPILAVGCKEMEASQKLIMEAKAGVVLPQAEQIKEYLEKQLRHVQKETVQVSVEILQRYDRKKLAMKLIEHMAL